MLQTRLNQLRQLGSNTGWLLGVELLAKVSRIVTIIALAASLTPLEYGTVMLALAAHEVIRLVLRSGTGAQIVQCDDKQLPLLAGNAYLVQWLFCLGLAAIQLALAQPIGAFYDNPDVSYLLILMALVYAIYPIVSVNVFLLHRANRMREFSLRNGACIIAENLSIAIFAVCGGGILAVAVGKWVFALGWLLSFVRVSVPHFSVCFQWHRFTSLIHTSSQLVLTELTRSLRLHMDVFIAGRLLSPELFGLYSFAKNAGVGLTNSLSNAYTSALYPYVCRQQRQGEALHSLWIYGAASLIGALFALQALAVPVYVPILFGEQWHAAQTTTAILCLVAIPTIWIDTLCTFKRAKAHYRSELHIRIFCLVVSAALLLITMPQTPVEVALTILFSSVLWLGCLFAPSLKPLKPFRLLNLNLLTSSFRKPL